MVVESDDRPSADSTNILAAGKSSRRCSLQVQIAALEAIPTLGLCLKCTEIMVLLTGLVYE